MTMRNGLFLASLGLAVAAVGVGLRARKGLALWKRKTSQLLDQLECLGQDGLSQRVDFASLEELPHPVQRYFRFALQEGHPLIRSARVSQRGQIRLAENHSIWTPFQATQYVAAQVPGFLWDAQVSLPLGLSLHVRDAYVGGHGLAQVNALSLIDLATVEDKPELTSGALMRYLAEAVWVPTTLLPEAGVKWTPIDGNKALATMTDGTTTVSLEFHFGETGEVTSVYTPSRYREVGGQYVPTPWRGIHGNYQERRGMKIPTSGEVEWYLPTGKTRVWKGCLERIEYDFAP